MSYLGRPLELEGLHEVNDCRASKVRGYDVEAGRQTIMKHLTESGKSCEAAQQEVIYPFSAWSTGKSTNLDSLSAS